MPSDAYECTECGAECDDIDHAYLSETFCDAAFCSEQCRYEYESNRGAEVQRAPNGTLSYDYNVPVRMLGDGPYQYAVEIECLNPRPDYDVFQEPVIAKKFAGRPRKLWAKADGSTVPVRGMGFEFVSAYMTLTQHHAFGWQDIMSVMRKRGWRSWSATRFPSRNGGQCCCGIHVSIPIQHMSSSCVFWMQKLVYDNPRAMSILFRRDDETADRYARLTRPRGESLVDIAKYKIRGDCTDKYQAINISSGRVELRRFRGTLNAESMLGCIEIVDGMYRYANTLSAKNADQCTGPAFISWLKNQNYLYLSNILNTKENEEVCA